MVGWGNGGGDVVGERAGRYFFVDELDFGGCPRAVANGLVGFEQLGCESQHVVCA